MIGQVPGAPLTIDDIVVGEVYWAHARHHLRRVRVVAKARKRVTVAYRLSTHLGGIVRRQILQTWNLHREPPARGHRLNIEPPSLEDARG